MMQWRKNWQNAEGWRDKADLLSRLGIVLIAFFLPLSTTVTVILFPLTAICGLASGGFGHKFVLWRQNWVAILCLTMFIMFVVGLTYTSATWPDALLILRKYDKFLFGFLLLPLFETPRSREAALNAFLFGCMVLAAIMYLKLLHLIGYSYRGNLEDVIKNHIEFNFLLAFASYLVLVKIATTYARAPQLFWTFILVGFVYVITFVSAGRSGYFVLAALIFLFCLQKWRWRGLLLGAIAVGCIGGFCYFASPVFQARNKAAIAEVQNYAKITNTSMGERIYYLQTSWQLVKAHPFFGTGTGSFVGEYAKLKPALSTTNPHNEYLHIAVQFGMVGVLLLLLLFAIQLWQSVKLPQGWAWVAQGTVVAIMAGCFANSWLMDTTEGHLYVFFTMLAASALRPENTEQ